MNDGPFVTLIAPEPADLVEGRTYFLRPEGLKPPILMDDYLRVSSRGEVSEGGSRHLFKDEAGAIHPLKSEEIAPRILAVENT